MWVEMEKGNGWMIWECWEWGWRGGGREEGGEGGELGIGANRK